MVNRGDSRGLSAIIATLLIIIITFVAIAIIWIVVKNVIQSGTEQVSLGKFTLNLEIKSATINPAIPNYILVRLKRNTGEGEISGLKFIFEDGNTAEVVEVNNYSMKQLEERTFNLSLSEISNASNIIKISVAPIFQLESGKEITGDVKDEYEVPKTSISGGTPCVPNCAGKQCGSNGCGGSCGTCGSGDSCNSTGQCIPCTPDCTGRICGLDPVCGQSCGTCTTGTCNSTGQCVITCTPATCASLGKNCGTWANGTCAGTLDCGNCTAGYTCNSTGQCVAATMVWTNELVVNEGFEWNNLTGWTTSGSYWGTSGDITGNNTPANGSYFAYTGNGGSSTSYIYQDVNLASYASQIDSGAARVNASGWIESGELPPQDWVRIQIMYLFANGTIIKTSVDSGNIGIFPWKRYGVFNDAPPVGARYVRVWGNTYEVGYASGALDGFSVKVGYFA